MRVLILYAKAGNGHFKAAEAIKEKLNEHYKDVEVVFEDGLEYSSRIANQIVVKGYANMTKLVPSMWGTIYSKADTKEKTTLNEIAKLIHKGLTIRLKKLLREVRPDIIVSTHPFVSKTCAYLKKKNKTDAKIVTILTDYAVHNMWLEDNKYYDKILVATEEMKDDCIESYNIEEEKVVVTGIPTSLKFAEKYDREKTLKEYGLEEKLTFLFFAGGGQGIGQSKDIFEELLNIDGDFQVVAVSGKNEKQKAKFEIMANSCNKKIVVLGYTNDVPALMNMCDFVISKPGGLTSTECLVMNKPMIIINPIPGQEEQNAIYFTNNGTAVRAYEGEPLRHPINTLVKDKFRVNQLKEMCKKIARPNAVDEIVKNIIELYE